MAILGVQPLGAVGSAGQNTKASQIDLPPEFATSAVNCFVDQSGRLTARYSFIRDTADNTDLTTSAQVKRVYRHNLANGTSVFACSGNGRIFTANTTTLTSRSSGHSADLWQFATLNGKLFAAQASHSLRYFDESTWAQTTLATPSNPRAITAAYGRLWALSADGWTLHWSDLLDGTNFTTGASGSLDLSKLHTAVRSPAVAVVGFSRLIVVLCESQILVLGLASNLNPNDSTTPIYLSDAISGVGCVARDTAVSIGDDLLFLASDGLRSLRRSLAERQGPAELMTLSRLNQRAITEYMGSESSLGAVAGCWDYKNAWYQLFLPTANVLLNFDFGNLLEGGTPRMTEWQLGGRPVHHGAAWTDDVVWYGAVGGLAHNTEYDDTDTYDMSVMTGWLSLSSPDSLKHLKALLVNLRGGNNQAATLRWYVDFDEAEFRSRAFSIPAAQAPAEYGIAEFNTGEFTTGITSGESRVHIGSSAKFVKFYVSVPINGKGVTLNNVQAFTNRGRIR